MRQATHNGTCQICGGLQALPNGVLSKHGYTVQHHYFEGVCVGAHHEPLETERAYADKIAAELLVSAANHDADAGRVLSGDLLPSFAWTGEYKPRPDGAMYRYTKREPIMCDYLDAPDAHKESARAELRNRLLNRAHAARATSKAIIENADRVHGKRELQVRQEGTKKVIGPGTVVRIGGKGGHDVTVLRTEWRVAQGCGPYLNGNSMLHIVYTNSSGKERCYPVRLIRQSAIVDAKAAA